MSESSEEPQIERRTEAAEPTEPAESASDPISDPNNSPNQFKSVQEVERILEKCISIAKENQHMINETCNHIINRNRKRNKDDFDLVTVMQIGYPIYVSPLTTSFSETSGQLTSIIGKPLSFGFFIDLFKGVFNRIRLRCDQTCVSRTALQPYATSTVGSSNVIEVADPRLAGDSLCSFGLIPNKGSLSNTISNVETSKF